MERGIVTIKAKDDGDPAQASRDGRDEKWSDSGYSLEVKQTVFVDGLDIAFKRKRGVKNNAQVFDQCFWKNRVMLREIEKIMVGFGE